MESSLHLKGITWLLFLAFLLNALIMISVNAQQQPDDERQMFFLNGEVNLTVPVYVAAFGDRLLKSSRFNLMFPPMEDDGYLCTLPARISSSTTKELNTYINSYPKWIALYVKLGNCSAEQKAGVAVQIRTQMQNIKFLLIHGTNPEVEANSSLTLKPDSDQHTDNYNSIVVVYVPYAQATRIAARMGLARSQPQGASKYLLDPGSVYWRFEFAIKGLHSGTGYDGGPSWPSGHEGFIANSSANFYWFRFILFGLLIAAPCFRALYLWYAGGGRIYFRRNERGRIVGMQYIPPIPFWLAAGRILPDQQSGLPIQETLTEEEFTNLPEIKYQPQSTEVETVVENPIVAADVNEEVYVEKGDDIVVVESETPDERDTATCPQLPLLLVEQDLEKQLSADVKELVVSKDGNLLPSTGPTSETAPSPAVNDSIPALLTTESIERPTLVAPERLDTTCTTCSICIDDFEPGETLILLPRCKHAFHRDCIHPWLLERQGCCPLCKTNVLGDNQATAGGPSADGEPQQRRRTATLAEDSSWSRH